MDIEAIRRRVEAGNYFVKSHAVRHALKQGFERCHMVEAVVQGTIIEEYPDDQRALVCGRTTLMAGVVVYMHVVCEYAGSEYVDFVTAYIPDDMMWEKPPFRRRNRQRK